MIDRVRGVALRQIARRHRRLSQLPVRQAAVRGVPRCPAGRIQRARAHRRRITSRYFEACLPIEEIARRGRDTLRFGPMKPMGLDRSAHRPPSLRGGAASRRRNARAGSYNLVGFQNHMRFGDQQRVLRMIPGLEHAEFLRYGQVHRNTYINGSRAAECRRCNCAPLRTFFSRARFPAWKDTSNRSRPGLVAGRAAAARAPAKRSRSFPRETAIGSLCAYVSGADPANYQPANITFDLLPKLENPPRDRKLRHAQVCRRALAALEEFQCAHVWSNI